MKETTTGKNKLNTEGLATFWLGPELKGQLQAVCRRKGVSQSALARWVFRLWLQEREFRGKEEEEKKKAAPV
jgi:hypothetical protein